MLRIFSSRAKITQIAIDPPKPASDRCGVAIVLIVRNEARHIAEWARFHHQAGVRSFFVYDNGSTDGTMDILRAVLGPAVVILPWAQVFRNGRTGGQIHNQVLAYAHAAQNFGGAYRWFAYIDSDEFLIPMQAGSIPGALAHLDAFSNVSLPWHMFGRNGFEDAPDGGVIQNYLKRASDPMSNARGIRNFKCIVDPCQLSALRVHSMKTNGDNRTVNDRGDEVTIDKRSERAFYSVNHLQLNHYYTRSNAELEAKLARGPNLKANAKVHAARVWTNVTNIEAEEVEDRAALNFAERAGLNGLVDPVGIS